MRDQPRPHWLQARPIFTRFLGALVGVLIADGRSPLSLAAPREHPSAEVTPASERDVQYDWTRRLTIVPKLGLPWCVASGANTVVVVEGMPETGWASVRVYFRRGGEHNFYYLEARLAESGRFWVTLPKPEPDTSSVECFAAGVDREGLATAAPLVTVAVDSSCPTSLTGEEVSLAQNLVVGETSDDQRGLPVSGFLCDGIIARITVRRELQPSEDCSRTFPERRPAFPGPPSAAGLAPKAKRLLVTEMAPSQMPRAQTLRDWLSHWGLKCHLGRSGDDARALRTACSGRSQVVAPPV
jgi:hypothetical protein